MKIQIRIASNGLLVQSDSIIIFNTELTRPKLASIGGGYYRAPSHAPAGNSPCIKGRLSPVWTRLTFRGCLIPPLNEVSFNEIIF